VMVARFGIYSSWEALYHVLVDSCEKPPHA